MPQLANDRHEKFCVCIADGLGTLDAYCIAGYTRSPSAASQLKSRPEIQQRIQELISERQAAGLAYGEDMENLPAELNREWLIKTLMKNVSIAQKEAQIAPANKAVELLAELIGLSFKKPGGALSKNDDEAEEEKGNNAVDVDKMADAFRLLNKVLPDAPALPPAPAGNAV